MGNPRPKGSNAGFPGGLGDGMSDGTLDDFFTFFSTDTEGNLDTDE